MDFIFASFKAGAQADLDAWDCNAMYPKPQPVDFGQPKWLGGLGKVASQGFKVYNMIKPLIPSKAGAGNVPGSPSKEEEIELDLDELKMTMPKMPKVDWNNAKTQGKALGMKLLNDIETAQKEKTDNMASRVRIW